MELPPGIKTKYYNGRAHVLHLLRNLYGQRQAGKVWADFLHESLVRIGFAQSKIYECLFYRGSIIFIVYVCNYIFSSPSRSDIYKAIQDLRYANFEIEDQVNICNDLDFNVTKLPVGRIKLSQHLLINQIIKDVKLHSHSARVSTSAKSTRTIRRELTAPLLDRRFNYQSVIVKLNFLKNSTRADISYATHQVDRFVEYTRPPHGEAVDHLVNYLHDMRKEGLILDSKRNKSFEIFYDTDFPGNWYVPTAADDPSTARSRSGYIVTYAGCPITWIYRLQKMVALSSCQSKHVSFYQSLYDTTPLMGIMIEFKTKGFDVVCNNPIVRCKAFEYNSGALDLAHTPKMRPRSKHINCVHHIFSKHVRKGEISIMTISNSYQCIYMYTKTLLQNHFVKFHKCILGS